MKLNKLVLKFVSISVTCCDRFDKAGQFLL